MARLIGLGLLTTEAEIGWPIIHRLVAAFVQAKTLDEVAQAQVEKAVIKEVYRLGMAGYPLELLYLLGQLLYINEQKLTGKDAVVATLASDLSELGYDFLSLGKYVAHAPS